VTWRSAETSGDTTLGPMGPRNRGRSVTGCAVVAALRANAVNIATAVIEIVLFRAFIGLLLSALVRL